MISRTVSPVHFEDYSGANFERLVFAYHLREGWRDLAWYGQVGSDLGRDLIGTEPRDGTSIRTVIQCVNRGALTLDKCERDMAKAISAPTGKPVGFKFVCRAAVSARQRDEISKKARAAGIKNITIWSGAEFEEHLRLRAEPLLQRFISGTEFPNSPADLRKFVDEFPDLPDADALNLMAAVFERPAFNTPFHEESSLPAFQQAIEDTIAALNIGIWRTREGDMIRRLLSLHTLKSPALRDGMDQIVRLVDEVRSTFKRRLTDGSIKHCRCGDVSCPVFLWIGTLAKNSNKLAAEFSPRFRHSAARSEER
jgi:hypothetical protein